MTPLTDATATGLKEANKWRWWAGRGEDEYRLAGPCLTREDALNDAYGDTEPGDTIFLIEAIADDYFDDATETYPFVETRNRSHVIRDEDKEVIVKLNTVAIEMASFEVAFPLCDLTKHNSGAVVAGRIRYAEPTTDKMFSAWLARAALLPSASVGEDIDDLWLEICEMDDRTSPEEYPEMCMLTRDEFAEFIGRAQPVPSASVGGEREASYARLLIAEMLHGDARAIDRAIVDNDDRVFIAMYDVEALVAGMVAALAVPETPPTECSE